MTVAAVAGVLALVVLVRPGGEDASSSGTAGRSAPSSSATAVPTPTTQEFCEGWWELAQAQGAYVADSSRADALEQAAQALLDLGVPERMTLPARGGYFRVIAGVYASLGLTLDPDRVPGVGDGPVPEGADAAFSSFLNRFCPA